MNLSTQPRMFHEYYRRSLLEDVIPFWFPRCLDQEHGGYLHCLDRDGSLMDTDKAVWAHGRMAWMLATLYNTVDARSDWLDWSRSGIEFLRRHGSDVDSRMFFHLTREGLPIRKRRYAFSESFTAIAEAAYAKATGEDQAATRAHELFDRFVDCHFNPGKMLPKFTGTRPMTDMGSRMIALVTAQELRENLGPDPKWTRWTDRCLDEMERLFVKPDLECVMENVGVHGEIMDHFDGRLLNPGHAIEGAWFVLREAEYRRDSRLIQLGCRMLDWMWRRGWDTEFGGLYYFRDLHDKPVQEYWHDMKFWWPHDEAIIATLMAYQLTGEQRYADWHQLVHDWSFQHFSDVDHGEWYGYLHRDGRVSVPVKGNLWKSFFHHPRMLWYCSVRTKGEGEWCSE